MREYYYDTWTEDGTTPTGYRETGWFTPTHIERRKFAMIEPGAVIPALVLGPITRTDIVKYAGASWDFNPFHHDELFAKRARSGEIIAHGMLIMAYLGRSATGDRGTGEGNKFTGRSKSVTRTGCTLRI